MTRMSPDAADITLNDVINAHLLLAVANGYYTRDMIARNIGYAEDVKICARLAFHEANVYRQLRQWADTSAFAHASESITWGGSNA